MMAASSSDFRTEGSAAARALGSTSIERARSSSQTRVQFGQTSTPPASRKIVSNGISEQSYSTLEWIGGRDSYILNMKTSSTNPTTPNATNDVSPIGSSSPICLAMV